MRVRKRVRRGKAQFVDAIAPDVATRLIPRLITAYWQYFQWGDTNLDSSERSGIVKLTPDCHHGTTGSDSQRVGYAVSR
jgi:hypothetical protein